MKIREWIQIVPELNDIIPDQDIVGQFFPIGNEGFDFSTMKIMDDETTGPSGMGFDQSTAALWVASGFEPTEPRQLLRRFPNWQTPDLEQALVMFDKGKGGVSGLYIWIAKGEICYWAAFF